MTLTEFLLARLAEQRTECDGTGEYSGCWHLSEFAEEAVAAMKRAVELTAPEGGTHYAYGWEDVQMVLALPYADHPDYDEAWRP